MLIHSANRWLSSVDTDNYKIFERKITNTIVEGILFKECSSKFLLEKLAELFRRKKYQGFYLKLFQTEFELRDLR